ncbi:MAG TPA: right-handed parallel beta-helix repeat-containing protein, partial [Rudaea sp.]
MAKFRFPMLRAFAALTVLACSPLAQAIVPQCVSTAAGLQAALTAAQNDHQPNYIGLEVGTYTLTGPLAATIVDGGNLTIEGGYPAASNCLSLPTTTPDGTIITGANASGTSVSLFSSGGGVTLRNLTLTGLKPAVGTSAVLISDDLGTDQLLIENVAVHHNNVQGVNDKILALFPGGGMILRDNIVHDNGNADATVYVYSNYPGLPLAIVNNTIANNAAIGLSLDLSGISIPTALFNNVLWNNAPADLRLDNTRPLAFNNTWKTQVFEGASALAPGSANNDGNDPMLLSNFRLDPASPAANAGIPAPMLLPLADAAENLRVQGSAPDRGAYETIASDQAYLVVNDARDLTHADDATITCAPSKPCTLREAMNKANSFGPSHIAFHLASDCSSVSAIILTSPLPDITVPLFIDGFSEPGATVNVQAPGNGVVTSNAKICVTLFGNGGSSAVSDAFSVSSLAAPNVHVEISGVSIYNFATAIAVYGGNGHWIHGVDFYGPFFG